MTKVLAVLYPDPVTGFPPKYVRDDIPKITHYPDGSSVPTPENIDFKPGELLGSVSGGLGLRKYLESQGIEYVVTSDKEGPDSVFEKELPTADVVISQPFWPAYLTAERLDKAKNLKLAITAGIGSDHVDLNAANEHNVTVAEVTYSNSISVAEAEVMQLLALVRNFIPAHDIVRDGGWNIADAASRAYDIEGMTVGVIGAGRIGRAVLERLKPFGVKLVYNQRHQLPADVEQSLGLTYYPDVHEMVKIVDAAVLAVPLHAQTYHLFNDDVINTMKRGAYIVNNSRGEEVDRDAIVRALKSGQLGGYSGDVWYPQPAPKDHPWRTMPNEAMTPHMSGTTLSAQARYAAGTREILEAFLENKPIRPEYLIAQDGHLAGTGAKVYTVQKGHETPGSGQKDS
ncbi:NAD-dependent formate dehydrogenase [Agrilactobacillus fermenti]|uniref:NAD-dependent formate dehydrogenase n=1 Tax=Agrilactobacillus fermenti TaxID=2586909 RepID=UPI001E430754|nr:NAD-dependent formate dehydrogenase [Agrilactobacillus fermenti]MCD2255388.1 NAD-dependent formate dehydrogenase [Agrilactobacillus fermenti]